MKKSIIGFIIILFSSNAFGQVEYGSITHDGLEREYIMYVPSSSGPNGPLVFSLHGYDEPAEDHMNYTFMKEVADTAGFMVCYPKAIDDRWNSGININSNLPTPNVDDVGFISALIDTLQADYAIDLDRIYVFGFSNGGFMTFRLACELNDRFAKAASVSGAMTSTTTASCNSAFPIPMLLMHGTADPFVLYYGTGGWSSVEETLDQWLNVNGCILPADTIPLPDIDPTDGNNIDVFIYQNCTENSSVLLYKMYGVGHTWPGWSEEWEVTLPTFGPTNRDIIADVELWKFFNSDSFSINGVWATNINLSSSFMIIEVDSLTVTAPITNTDDHSYSAYAIIQSFDSTLVDSILLFDDGEHGDGSALDGLVGGTIQTQSIESHFSVQISTMDLDDNEYLGPHDLANFTTIGPIVPDSAEIARYDGSLVKFRVPLKNEGLAAGAPSIFAIISTVDSCISALNTGAAVYQDINAGETITSFDSYRVTLNPNCDLSKELDIPFDIEILSDGYTFWTDSFDLHVIPVGVEDEIAGLPSEYSLSQAFPNPFNPRTTIEYSLPKAGAVSLIVYNLLGQEVIKLVSKNQQAGYHKVRWNASNVSSGIYFYRLHAGDFLQTKKMVLLK